MEQSKLVTEIQIVFNTTTFTKDKAYKLYFEDRVDYKDFCYWWDGLYANNGGNNK